MKASVLANRKRAHLNQLLKKYGAKTQVFEDYARVERVISDQATSYQFDPRSLALQDVAVHSLQKGVNTNDLFVATDLAMFLDTRETAKQGLANPQTFPNPAHFAVGGATTAHLEAFYNAQFSLQVGTRIFINRFDTRAFRIEQAQNVSITSTSTVTGPPAVATYTNAVLPSHRKFVEEFYQGEPVAVISGKAENTITIDNIKLPASAAVAASTSGYENVITLYMRGFTVVNAADDWEAIAKDLAKISQQG